MRDLSKIIHCEPPTNKKWFVDIKGLKFGRLTVVKFIGKHTGNFFWECLCSCGKSTTVRSSSLKRGKVVSCGCYGAQRVIEAKTKHGLAGTREYVAWASIIHRCTNQNAKGWKDYGGRGITICDRWRSFTNFIADVGMGAFAGCTIERIDNNGSYEPGNVRWATRKEQARNRRSNRHLTFKGRTKPIAAWADEVGVSAKVIYLRLFYGWSTERALTQPTQSRQPRPRISNAA